MKFRDRTRMELLAIYGPLLLLILAGFAVALHFVEPAPPKRIVIASGEAGGAYQRHAEQYRRLLEKQGVELEILETRGSVENLQLLSSGKVDIAFIQGGVGTGRIAGLEGLGSLYFEPLWLFHRAALQMPQRLSALRGRSISVGPDGSGTQALVRRLMADNDLSLDEEGVMALPSAEAGRRLEQGSLDAAFFVASLESDTVRALFHSPRVKTVSFERAEAYARRYPFITSVVLPEGSEDLARNLPDRDLHLLATTSALVVREGVHPAMVGLLMQVIEKVHGQPGWFEQEGEFPTPDYLEFPLNAQAKHYYKNGPPFLQRYLPFWAASFLDRVKIMMLPLLGLLLPMFKIGPPLYRWRMRSRIYRWYDKLEEVDMRAANDPEADPRELHEVLDGLEQEVRDIKVPLSFSDQLYHLRLHIDFVRRRLEKKRGSSATP